MISAAGGAASQCRWRYYYHPHSVGFACLLLVAVAVVVMLLVEMLLVPPASFGLLVCPARTACLVAAVTCPDFAPFPTATTNSPASFFAGPHGSRVVRSDTHAHGDATAARRPAEDEGHALELRRFGAGDEEAGLDREDEDRLCSCS